MIIQMNATVCAAVDHGRDGQPRPLVAGNSGWSREVKGGVITRGNRMFSRSAEVMFLACAA
jgi:hypothetical protein